MLLVLLSLRYSSTYAIVFRNSAFAVSTVFLRLALTSPPLVKAGLGLGALLLAIAVTVAYHPFSSALSTTHRGGAKGQEGAA